MTTAIASQSSRAERGIKRACLACEVRFYDLMRDPIVCPACSAVFTPEAPRPVYEVGTFVTPSAGKSAWRKASKRPGPMLPEPDRAAAPETAAAEELEGADDEDVKGAAPDDDIVLEQEPDDADVSGLIDVDVEEPKGNS